MTVAARLCSERVCDWDFVAFDVHDTSTFRCSPPVITIPADDNDQLAIGPVFVRGTSEVVGPTSVRVGGQIVPGVEVNERVTFSGGQSGFNSADTWLSAATGLPLRGPGTPSFPRRHRSGTRRSTHMGTSR